MSAFIYNTTIYKLYIDCNNYLYLQNLSTSYHKLCILFIFFPPLQLKWIFESLQTTKYWFIFCKLLVYRLPNLMHSPVPFIFYSLLKSTLSILFIFFSVMVEMNLNVYNNNILVYFLQTISLQTTRPYVFTRSLYFSIPSLKVHLAFYKCIPYHNFPSLSITLFILTLFGLYRSLAL